MILSAEPPVEGGELAERRGKVFCEYLCTWFYGKERGRCLERYEMMCSCEAASTGSKVLCLLTWDS